MVDVADPAASVEVYNDEHRAVLVATTEIENERSGRFRAGEEVVFSFTLRQRPGSRALRARCSSSPIAAPGLDVIDRFEGSFSFVVTGPAALGGLVDLPVQSAISRVTGAGRRRADGAHERRGAPSAGRRRRPDRVPYEALGRPISGPRRDHRATGGGSGTSPSTSR